MQVLWSASPPLTSRVVMDGLASRKNWKIQTVATLLTRLVGKGFLGATKEGREVRYRILVSESEYMELETQSFVSKYQGGSISSLVAAFADQGVLSDEDFAGLSAWLEEQKRSRG